MLALPLVMPPVATGLILLRLLGRRGAVGGFVHDTFGFDIVFTWRAVVAAMAVMSLPLLVRSARHAFEGVDPRFEHVARTLGAGWPRVLREITLPLAARGILGGVLLAFARALGEFGATILVAGNIPGRTTTLALAIYSHVQLGEDGAAYRLLAISVVVAFSPSGPRNGSCAAAAPAAARGACGDPTVSLRLQGLRVPLADFAVELEAEIASPVTVICGPSGAGKTTLLETLAGLRRPRAGRIVARRRDSRRCRDAGCISRRRCAASATCRRTWRSFRT